MRRIDSQWTDHKFVGWRLGPLGFMRAYTNVNAYTSKDDEWRYDYWKTWFRAGRVDIGIEVKAR